MATLERPNVEYYVLPTLLESSTDGTYLAQVPRYQREFVWTADRACDWLTKLWDSAVNPRTDLDRMPIFQGTIVFQHDPTNPASAKLIVDGQQRLTCFTLINAAIVRIAQSEFSPERATRLTTSAMRVLGSSQMADDAPFVPRLLLKTREEQVKRAWEGSAVREWGEWRRCMDAACGGRSCDLGVRMTRSRPPRRASQEQIRAICCERPADPEAVARHGHIGVVYTALVKQLHSAMSATPDRMGSLTRLLARMKQVTVIVVRGAHLFRASQVMRSQPAMTLACR